MSEHRRKPPQTPGGGRAAARRGAQQQPPPSGGRRAVPSASGGSHGSEPERPYGSRAEARRAAQRGGRRRNAAAVPPPKRRLLDYPRWGKQGWRRWMPSWKQVTGLCIAFFGSLVALAGVGYAWVDVPDVNRSANAQNNVYYWANGERMVATGGEINRQIVPIEKIPDAMQYAVISAENKTFETDSGIDPIGIGRAMVNMAMGGETQGGSTITQQYVKNSMLDQSQTLSRKFKELFISIKVDQQKTKDEILAGYLNTSYYGRGAYGIQAAAQTYYGKNSEDLNPSECAFLTALLKGPTYFDPAGAVEIDPAATPEANRENSERRWKWILDEEVKDGHLSAAERNKYTKYPEPDPRKKNANEAGQIGYLVSLAKSYFINNNDRNYTEEDLAQGGFQIHTTFDKKKVDALEAAVAKVLKENIDEKARPDLDSHVQFGGASVDPEDGAIVAVYGGTDATEHFTNNADETGAQVGSTFKPFVLAAAMDHGVRDPELGPVQSEAQRTKVSPDKTIYNGANDLLIRNYDGSVWKNEKGEEWHQENDGKESYGDVNLREAMRESANSPYVQLGMDVGTDKVKDAAVAAGLREGSLASFNNSPSFSLGTSSPSAIRMAGAYATFAARGDQNAPYSVTKVEKDGETVFTHEKKARQAFSQAIADNVTDVLTTVVEAGTGTNAQLPGNRPVAGKTGTTDGNRSAWFIGYTPQLSTSIGMWRIDPNAEKKEFLEMYGTGGRNEIHGASFPSEIWADYMSDALKGEKILQFPEPEKIGEEVWGGGAESPEPTPTATGTPSATPSATPSRTPTQSPTTPAPTPSTTCPPWDPSCRKEETTDGATGGTGTPEPTTTETDGGGNNGNGSGNTTGWIGG